MTAQCEGAGSDHLIDAHGGPRFRPGARSPESRLTFMDEQVIGFIRRRFQTDCNWLTGNCYYFALILHDRFPWGRVMYDTADGHFVVEIDGVKYDWTGVVDESAGPHNYVPWKKFAQYDRLQYERIERDCIM